jgi:hypothetical protein
MGECGWCVEFAQVRAGVAFGSRVEVAASWLKSRIGASIPSGVVNIRASTEHRASSFADGETGVDGRHRSRGRPLLHRLAPPTLTCSPEPFAHCSAWTEMRWRRPDFLRRTRSTALPAHGLPPAAGASRIQAHQRRVDAPEGRGLLLVAMAGGCSICNRPIDDITQQSVAGLTGHRLELSGIDARSGRFSIG